MTFEPEDQTNEFRVVAYGLFMLMLSVMIFHGILSITEHPPSEGFIETNCVGAILLFFFVLCLYLSGALLSFGYLHKRNVMLTFMTVVGVAMFIVPMIFWLVFAPNDSGSFFMNNTYWFLSGAVELTGTWSINYFKRKK